MDILTKLTLRFFLIVTPIFILFTITIYTLSAEYRQEEFFDRLEKRAVTTARLLLAVEEVNKDLLRIIDKNSIPALPQEEIFVFDREDVPVYTSVESPTRDFDRTILLRIRKEKQVRWAEGSVECLGLLYEQGPEAFVTIAAAYDRYGRNKLRNLRMILISGLIVGSGIIVLAGRWFASQALQPLAAMNAQVSRITAGNLEERIDEGNRKDEIARLAMNFNQMLQRLSTAFQMQREFVSNASHELRTPLAVMRSQLQVILEKERSGQAYREVLESLLDDTDSFTQLTNGLLILAQSGVPDQYQHFSRLRVDELLFSAQEELAARRPDYLFRFSYDHLPDYEDALLVNGNEQLLQTAFTNLMDNGCKFSADHSVNISLSSGQGYLEIRFTDQGIGIPASEIGHIFTPFYRARNVRNSFQGHGIGLSLCQQIVSLHHGHISVDSRPGQGTSFTVRFPLATDGPGLP